MPRRAQPGDRERIEAAMGPRLRAALDVACETLGVPRDRWQEIPALHYVFVTAAVVRLAGRIQSQDGTSSRAAVETAALRCGVSPDTILARTRALSA